MNWDEAIRNGKLMVAWGESRGEFPIQYRFKEQNNEWESPRSSHNMAFDFDHIEYREKPKSAWRPWTAAEAIGRVICPRNRTDTMLLITAVDGYGFLTRYNNPITPQQALDDYEEVSTDGKRRPCGVFEESKEE